MHKTKKCRKTPHLVEKDQMLLQNSSFKKLARLCNLNFDIMIRERKINNYLKLGVFLFGISLLLWNCEKEENYNLQPEQAINSKTPFETLSFQEVLKQKEFQQIAKISETEKYFTGTTNLQSRSASNSTKFKVVKKTAKKIVKDKYTSYTFLIERNGDDHSNENHSFENLVIEKKNDSISAFIIKYVPSTTYLESQNAAFSGKLSIQKVEYDSSWLSRQQNPDDCRWVTTYTIADCTVHGTGGIYNSACNNYGENAIQYSSNYVCTEGESSFDNGEGTGDNNHGGSSTSPIKPQINNNLSNPCAKAIFTELENGLYMEDPLKPEVIIPNIGKLNFSESILKLFNDSNKTNYTIQNGSIGDANASTVKSTTTMGDAYLQKATKLSIARTMIHETVHAYLNGVFFSYPGLVDKPFKDQLRQYALDKGYTDLNRFHHEFMAEFIDGMAYSLYEWDRNYGSGKTIGIVNSPDDLLGWDYYKSMACAGLVYEKKDSQGNIIKDSNGNVILEDTDSFKALYPNVTDRNNIKKINSDEAEGNSNAKGDKC